MFKSASNTLITGGTFTENVVHHHGFRESADILHRATATAAFHNSDERFDPPKCHRNTRLAVLSEIMKWIKWEGDLETFIMWVYGPAGAGKSAIAQTIAEMCEEEMILLASFFFSRNDPSRSSAKPLIATIAYQITINLPNVRDAILGVVERDPLIFSRSLAGQLKSLIVEPLQQLSEAGFFNEPTSRRLVIIDGLDECSDLKVQRNIVEVLGNAHRQHRLPLIFLLASRPEQHISLAFSSGVLPTATTCIALDESYRPDEDIELFFTDKFQGIKSTHRLRAYIPFQWPPPNVLQQLVEKSSGQFIYASTVIHYVSSFRHKPHDRLDIVLGIQPPQRDLPFAELDALYMQILAGVEHIDPVLEILSCLLLSRHYTTWVWLSQEIEEFLFMQPGDVELYLGDLSSIVKVVSLGSESHNHSISILHASLTDFLIDPTRSKGFWINPRARHATLARRCLQLLQRKGGVQITFFGIRNAMYYCEHAEMTPELHGDLLNISDVFNHLDTASLSSNMDLFADIFSFLSRFKKLPFPEAGHISQLLHIDFDEFLRTILAKCHHFPGIALLLSFLIEQTKLGYPQTPLQTHFALLIGSFYLPDTLYRTEFWRIIDIHYFHSCTLPPCGIEFLNYLAELLENFERSKTHVFDQQKYATASNECLQLCLCSHHTFSKGAMVSAHRDSVLRRSNPWFWRERLGVHSRIRKARHHFKIRRWKSLKARINPENGLKFYPSDNSPEYKYCQSGAYKFALDLLPSLLEKSAISLEMIEFLRRCTFTTMAQKFPRRMRLAKDAIAKYILRIESGVGEIAN